MENRNLEKRLRSLADEKYRSFQAKLMPTIPPETILGVRTPALRSLAKEAYGSEEAEDFLRALPHAYYDENNLHGALLEFIPDFDTALSAVERFLPYLDNWATCDMFCPKVLRQDPKRLLNAIERWLSDGHVYTVRYGLVRLIFWYLEAPIFSPEILELAASVKNDDYYVQMAVAWFFSMALAKQWEVTLPYITEERLDVWIHNKAIQKAIESYRFTSQQKQFLKGLKRKNAI